MAIIQSLAVGKAKGSAGQLTYAYVGGDTIMKGKVAFPKIPRTIGQMNRRVRWPNLVNMWQAMNGTLHPSFEEAMGRVSDYNMFIGRNNTYPVFLTKQEASMGGCVVAPYVVTEGSLPSIDTAEDGSGKIVSSINIGDLELDEVTTIAALSEAIINNNEGWSMGDQLSAYILRQTTNSVTGVPYVSVEAYEITLSDKTDPISTLYSTPYPYTNQSGKIGMYESIDGAVVYVHSRKGEDGKTLVSSQSLVVTSTIPAHYNTQAARDAAIESYGGKLTAPFLTPNVSVELNID